MTIKYNMVRWVGVIAVLSAGLISCEKVIDIKIPDKERRIVVNGQLIAGSPFMAIVSKSRSILEDDSLLLLQGARIKLYRGTESMGSFVTDGSGFYYLPGFAPKAGETYRLTAEGGGLQAVEAEAVVPQVVPILSVDTATLVGEWGQRQLMVDIRFKDPDGAANYYGFGAMVSYKDFDYQTQTFTGKIVTDPVYIYGDDDPFVRDESTNFQGELYFEDLLFDGQTKTVRYNLGDVSYFSTDTIWLSVRMKQVDQAYYRYVVSYNNYQQSQGNPFAEPVQVYTNITNGLGIFSGCSLDERTFAIPPILHLKK